MKSIFAVAVLVLLFPGLVTAESAAARVESAARVLNEIMATPDKGIPAEILGSAKCVAVVPSLIEAGGFVVGGSHGRGMATCRTNDGWSAPAPFTMTGGSLGFQIGGQAVDLVITVMNDRGMQTLLTSKFSLAQMLPLPLVRGTPRRRRRPIWKMRAEILTYSRARGLFCGHQPERFIHNPG